MEASSINWTLIVNTAILTLPSLVVAVTALIVALKSHTKVVEVEQKLNGKKTLE